jgi:hypothetical protein
MARRRKTSRKLLPNDEEASKKREALKQILPQNVK